MSDRRAKLVGYLALPLAALCGCDPASLPGGDEVQFLGVVFSKFGGDGALNVRDDRTRLPHSRLLQLAGRGLLHPSVQEAAGGVERVLRGGVARRAG